MLSKVQDDHGWRNVTVTLNDDHLSLPPVRRATLQLPDITQTADATC